MKQQIAAVEEQEKAAIERQQPQTVAEADALQKKLQDALDGLKKRRAELEKKEKEKEKEKAK